MSSTCSPNTSCGSTSKERKSKRPKTKRAPSASQIAKSSKDFETWSFHQRLETASYSSDIPDDLQSICDGIFDFSGRLPSAWADEKSQEYETLKNSVSKGFLRFLKQAYTENSVLLDDSDAATSWTRADLAQLQADLTIVYAAWERLNIMLKSGEKLSEADFVANVYNVFRSPAIKLSSHRVQKSICLPSPTNKYKLGTSSARILSAKAAIPDCVILLPGSDESMQALSSSAKSPFKVLSRQKGVMKKGNASKQSSFRYQATPCEKLPDTARFEFVSSLWEDKKPTHTLLADAYRQNRMSAASAARHLHSLHIRAPVFGLLWEHGNVRAHVDWCTNKFDSDSPMIYSAPYSTNQEEFHTWDLSRPSDILQVYFMIQNIDEWTMNGFKDAVIHGVNGLQKSVETGEAYHPWRRSGDIKVEKENILISVGTNYTSSTTTSYSLRPRR